MIGSFLTRLVRLDHHHEPRPIRCGLIAVVLTMLQLWPSIAWLVAVEMLRLACLVLNLVGPE